MNAFNSSIIISLNSTIISFRKRFFAPVAVSASALSCCWNLQALLYFASLLSRVATAAAMEGVYLSVPGLGWLTSAPTNIVGTFSNSAVGVPVRGKYSNLLAQDRYTVEPAYRIASNKRPGAYLFRPPFRNGAHSSPGAYFFHSLF